MQEGDATLDRYPTPEDVARVAALASPVISLFAPVTAAIPEAHQNSLRHRRTVQRARERLAELGVTPGADVEQALDAFAEEHEPPMPWVRTRALFASESGAVRLALPWAQDESASVGVAPRIRPVACAAALHTRFRVLALSKNSVRLYEGDPVALRERPGALPGSLEEALGDQVTEPALQLHSTRGGGAMPTWHGQGGAARERNRDRARFDREVARALEDLARKDPLALVLVAERRHRAAFEEALREDVGLLRASVDGNPDVLSETELHAKAWEVVAEAKRDEARRYEADLAQLRATAKYAGGWDDVAQAASMSRVQRLFLPPMARRRARLDPERGTIVPAWGDEELGDALAVAVLTRGGSVQVPLDPAPCGRSDDVCAQLR